ncbi:MAG TPA: MopE-related protein [Polyangia bacterium]|jgi:hypothetical protein|nr:MopE-related protein [Polyangia bacterium]
MASLRRSLLFLLLIAPASVHAQDLILDNMTMTLGGTRTYGRVVLTNNARIIVPNFNGTDRDNTGNLVLRADSIMIDATSSITARGAGYQARRCVDGPGPAAFPAAGGRGGCSVRDSGGGGAHFGMGGRGTKDCFIFGDANSCQFPQEFEEDCRGAPNNGDTACQSTSDCRNNDGLPTVAGQPFRHSPYAAEFGAAGGDKGCRDGDGFGSNPSTGGNGGGRIVLAAVNANQTGAVTVNGRINADGNRGCANGNDSGGGGAGGAVLIVGDQVSIGATAVISASGGLGGDSQNKDLVQYPECTGTQLSGTCDDCGGGGGGGLINVLSRTANINTGATFSVRGALGGTCTICQGEAGGGAGELQIDGAYVGEICDGYDNDFDGVVDNGFPNATCGQGSCAVSIPTCQNGSPPVCTPAVSSDPSCQGSRGSSRPRIALILDSSASMLLTLSGTTTFGDGSADHPGIDLSNDGLPNDSRLYAAKGAVSQLISSYPEIDFALARYHQDEGVNRSCQTSKWLECQGSCCTYDNPGGGNTSSPVACTLALPRIGGGTVNVTLREDSPLANRCINYAGTCGAPRRGADILVGFESDVRQYLMWLDGGETNFNPSVAPGNYCAGLRGDCELRGTGPTPIAESLRAIYDYVRPIQTVDPGAACRGYSVILVSDGGEECGGDPAQAAAELLTSGVRTYVIGVSVDATQGATLNAIAAAGGTSAFIPVNNASDLLPALTSIVSASIRTELCNGVDDNCNGVADEGYNVGAACNNGLQGACRGDGVLECDPNDARRTRCRITTQVATPQPEQCNGVDDNCNGLIDEGNPQGGASCGPSTGECRPGTMQCQGGQLDCVGGTGPRPEVCDGKDNDCDGQIDNDVPPGGPCGTTVGECQPGTFVCTGAGGFVCQGAVGPQPETCDGRDNDCNGIIDDNVPGVGQPCTTAPDGTPLCKAGVLRCASGQLRCNGAVPYRPPVCKCPPDECSILGDGPGSDGCPAGSACLDCACRTPCAPGEFPCSGNLVCRNGFCVPPQCGGRLCTDDETCVNNTCVDKCTQIRCPQGQICVRGGRCVEDSCYGRGCPTGQVCRSGACEADPCLDKSCAADEFCRDGLCVRTCEGVYCPAGQSCQNGACVADPCGGKVCVQGEVCQAGANGPSCVRDPCLNVSCGRGRVCQAGTCVDDPCGGVTCPGDPQQVVCQNGQCVSRTPPKPPDRVTVTGGRFFSCAVGGRAGGGEELLAGVVLALALGLARRRREASR